MPSSPGGRWSGRGPRRPRSTTPSSACSRSRGRRGSPPTGRRTGWPSSASPPSRACGGTLSERILVGADHAGFALKQRLVAELERLGYEPGDVGPRAGDPAGDFPDYAKPGAAAGSKGDVARGILTCGTGPGVADGADPHPHGPAAGAGRPRIAG